MRISRETLLVVLLLTLPAVACIWDSDTIDDELRGVPKATVIASGRWYRHGPAYYQARLAKLVDKKDLTLAEYDDLAVAQERLGFHKEALQTMEKKAAALAANPDPEHQYRYHANKGTILAHSGKFSEAVSELDLALELNPDAHFGRERYQRDLIRYLVAAKKDPGLWSERNFLAWAGYPVMRGPLVIGQPSFTNRSDHFADEDEWKHAFEGVSGMLRFGGLEGPELYRCLGDLFLTRHDLNLAWLFYLKAIEKKHPASSTIERSVVSIEDHWEEAGYRSQPSRADFRLTEESANLWLEAFQRAEEAALKAGESPSQPEVLEKLVQQANTEVPSPDSSGDKTRVPMATVVVVSIVVGMTALRRRRKRH